MLTKIYNFIKISVLCFLIGGVALVTGTTYFSGIIPQELQLKTAKENIVWSNEFTEYTYQKDAEGKTLLDANKEPIIESQKQVVAYAYKSGEIAPALDNEIIEKRTENIVTRNLGGEKRSAQSGYNFYKEGTDWKQIKFATTTPEVFDKETLSLNWIEKVFAANTAATSPGTMATSNANGGTVDWEFLGAGPDNAKAEDGISTRAGTLANDSAVFESSIKIIKGGTVQGDEKSTGATLPVDLTYVSYGGSTIKWGLSWTAEDINASTFGVVFAAAGALYVSYYLQATNFGFAIPVGSIINGILVEIKEEYSGPYGRIADVDHIRITVYYTEGGGTTPITLPANIIFFE